MGIAQRKINLDEWNTAQVLLERFGQGELTGRGAETEAGGAIKSPAGYHPAGARLCFSISIFNILSVCPRKILLLRQIMSFLFAILLAYDIGMTYSPSFSDPVLSIVENISFGPYF